MSLAYLQQESTPLHPDDIWALSWTSTNNLVSGCADGHLRIFDSTELSTPIHDIPSNPLGITSLSVSRDGKRGISGSLDGSVVMVDLSEGRVLGMVETGREKVGGSDTAELPAYACALHPELSCWAWSGRSSKVAIRPIQSSEEATDADDGMNGHGAIQENGSASKSRGQLGGVGSIVDTGKGKFGMDLQFSPDGRSLAVATEAGFTVVLDTETQAVVATYGSHAKAVRTISWSHDSQWLYSGSDDHRTVLHDVRAGSKTGSGRKGEGAVASMQGHTSWVLDVSASPDGRLLASGGADSTVKLWDVGTRTSVFSTTTSAAVWNVEWQPSNQGLGAGKQFATAGDDKAVTIYRAAGSV